MIAKHIPRNGNQSSSFAGLVNYIVKDVLADRPLMTNFISEDLKVGLLEAKAVQLQNTRAKGDRTYHLMFSFRPGERVDVETMRSIEGELCKCLGFAEHQRVSVVHRDTESTHVHVAINKVHPKTFRYHTPHKDYFKLARECEKLEKRFKLLPDNHQARRSVSAGRARDAEAHSGRLSLSSWIRLRLGAELCDAKDWNQFQRILDRHGLKLIPVARGFVFSASGVHCAASTVDRRLGALVLQQKLGVYPPKLIDKLRVGEPSRVDAQPSIRGATLGPDHVVQTGGSPGSQEERLPAEEELIGEMPREDDVPWPEEEELASEMPREDDVPWPEEEELAGDMPREDMPWSEDEELSNHMHRAEIISVRLVVPASIDEERERVGKKEGVGSREPGKESTSSGKKSWSSEDIALGIQESGLAEWMREHVAYELSRAENWERYLAVLEGYGLELHVTARGFLFGHGDNRVAASSVAEEFGAWRIQKKLGLYGGALVGKDWSSETFNNDSWLQESSGLFASYLEEQSKISESRYQEDRRADDVAFRSIGFGVSMYGKFVRLTVRDRHMRRLLYMMRRHAIRRRANDVRRELQQRRDRRVRQRRSRMTFLSFLIREASSGNADAMQLLRKNAWKEPFMEKALIISGETSIKRPSKDAVLTKTGTWVFEWGGSVVRCGAKGVSIDDPQSADIEAILMKVLPFLGDPISIRNASPKVTDAIRILERSGRTVKVKIKRHEAARLYVAERNTKRASGVDVARHRVASREDATQVIYAGQRHFLGQRLGLFDRDDVRLVMPISKYDSKKLKKCRLGTRVQLGKTSRQQVSDRHRKPPGRTI